MPEVVHQKEDGKWYYWTETWTEEYGPFDTKELAQEACNRYATEVLHHPEAPDQAPVVEPQEPVVLLALMPWPKLSDLDVDIAMEKCCFHEKKGKVDRCRYIHGNCMVGNQASLPKERGYIADVCLRGY